MNAGFWVYIIFVTIVLLFAIISNFMVIIAVVRFKNMRTVTHVLISNVAVCDILLGGVFVPQKLHDISHPKDYHEGIFLCKFVHFFPIIMITNCCYTLTFISYERRRAIMEPHKRQMTINRVLQLLPVLWVGSLVVALPSVFEYSVEKVQTISQENSSIIDVCSNTHFPPSLTFINCIFVVVSSFVIPLVLMFNNYTKIIMFIMKRCSRVTGIPSTVEARSQSRSASGVNRPSQSSLQNSHLYKNRIRLVKMLVLMAAAFAICWLPFFLLYMYSKLSGKDASFYSTSYETLVINVMMAFSTAYNVILYVIFNSAFRDAFKELLRVAARWLEKPCSRGLKSPVRTVSFDMRMTEQRNMTSNAESKS